MLKPIRPIPQIPMSMQLLPLVVARSQPSGFPVA
jgi:hypothetical protein